MTTVYGRSCDSARALLSRQLDTPLSELERSAVSMHVLRCVGCRVFERDTRWITEELRAAPLQPHRQRRRGTDVGLRKLNGRLLVDCRAPQVGIPVSQQG